jgi:hypothetical protein
LFGGYYPSSVDIEGDKSQAVQKGIWYSPEKSFTLFDIAVSRDDGSASFIPYKQAVEIAEANGLLHAEPLFIGPFHKAINFDPKFVTTIPKQLGLPAWDMKDNNCNFVEGIIVKRWDSVDPLGLKTPRPTIKIKIAEFQERQGAPP